MFLISLPGSHVYLAEYIQLILHIITRNIKLIMVQFAQTVTFPHCSSHYDSDFRVQAKRLVLYRPALIVLSHLHSHSLPLTLLQSPWAPTYSLSTPGRFSFETFFFFFALFLLPQSQTCGHDSFFHILKVTMMPSLITSFEISFLSA